MDADDEKIGEKTVTRKAAEKKAGENKKTDKDGSGLKAKGILPRHFPQIMLKRISNYSAP